MVALDPSTLTLLEADDEARTEMARAASKCHPEFIYRAMNLCNEADLNYRTASNKQFLVELTLAKICQLSSPSPDENRSGGEGQLKKISAATPSAPQQQQHASQPAAPITAAPSPSPQPMPVQAKPVMATEPPPPQYVPQTSKPKIKRTGSAQTFSISDRQGLADSPQATVEKPPEKLSTPFEPEKLHAAWQEFIKANPTRHILINTMRASFPAIVEGNTFKMMVENEKQHQEMAEALPAIHQYLRKTLKNDYVEILVEVNQGEASPHTWNERQVLSHMIEERPILKEFIDSFGLTL